MSTMIAMMPLIAEDKGWKKQADQYDRHDFLLNTSANVNLAKNAIRETFKVKSTRIVYDKLFSC